MARLTIDKHNAVTFSDPDVEVFARDYAKSARADRSYSDRAGQTRAHFMDTYAAKVIRNGFAGSGETVYTRLVTGTAYRVKCVADGRGFFGTTHIVSKVQS